jgi:hypothetical protein
MPQQGRLANFAGRIYMHRLDSGEAIFHILRVVASEG